MRRPFSKMMALEARHPGFCEKVHAMFDEGWPVAAISRIVETHYGERIGRTTLEVYKREHWRRLREQVQQARAALLGSASAASIPEDVRPASESVHPAVRRRGHRTSGTLRYHPLGSSGPAFIWRFGPVMKSTLRVMGSEER